MLESDDSISEDSFVPRPSSQIAAAGLQRPNSRVAVPRPATPMYLDKNENPDPRLQAWYQTILQELSPVSLSTYPDLGPLYEQLARWLGIPPEQLYLTAGCDGAIERTFGIFVAPGDRVLLTKPTFAMYPIYASAYGAKVDFLSYRRTDLGPELLLSEVLSAIEQRMPRLFCLPNPDSPTGTVFDEDDLHQIVETCGRTGTIFLVDEAYHPFSEVTAARFPVANPHVLVARTFSKAWGLAGLRAGYMIGHPETVEWFHRTRPMYEIGGFADAFLLRAISEPSQMLESVARLNAGRDYFAAAMTELGFPCLPSGGNFVHVAFGERAEDVHCALASLVLYRADANDPCLSGYSRFSSTTVELFEPVIETISTVL